MIFNKAVIWSSYFTITQQFLICCFLFWPCPWYAEFPRPKFPHHTSDPSCCSDNARSLTHCATGELQCFVSKSHHTYLFFSLHIIFLVSRVNDIKKFSSNSSLLSYWLVHNINLNLLPNIFLNTYRTGCSNDKILTK